MANKEKQTNANAMLNKYWNGKMRKKNLSKSWLQVTENHLKAKNTKKNNKK